MYKVPGLYRREIQVGGAGAQQLYQREAVPLQLMLKSAFDELLGLYHTRGTYKLSPGEIGYVHMFKKIDSAESAVTGGIFAFGQASKAFTGKGHRVIGRISPSLSP